MVKIQELNEKQKGKVSKKVVVLYGIIFYGIWSVFELSLKPMIDSQLIKTGMIKNLVWTVPALYLIYHFSSELFIPFKEMFTRKVNWLKWLPLFLGFTVYLLAGCYFNNGGIVLSPSFNSDLFIIFLFVGLTEELVFRGWLLNATIDNKNKWLAILINAVLFLLVHFPIWIHEGVLVENILNLDFVAVPVLSIIFSLSFIKSRSIFVPITLHMYWDLLMFLFW
ncbi:CPBP family intramembrane glutamic endopeptidase [Enterococcus sp. LJL99]